MHISIERYRNNRLFSTRIDKEQNAPVGSPIGNNYSYPLITEYYNGSILLEGK